MISCTRHTPFDPHTIIIISFIYANVELGACEKQNYCSTGHALLITIVTYTFISC